MSTIHEELGNCCRHSNVRGRKMHLGPPPQFRNDCSFFTYGKWLPWLTIKPRAPPPPSGCIHPQWKSGNWPAGVNGLRSNELTLLWCIICLANGCLYMIVGNALCTHTRMQYHSVCARGTDHWAFMAFHVLGLENHRNMVFWMLLTHKTHIRILASY